MENHRFRGQFSTISAFSVEKSREKWPLNVQYVAPAPAGPSAYESIEEKYLELQNKYGHFSIENHRFSGVILHYICIFNRKITKQLAFMLQFAVLRWERRHRHHLLRAVELEEAGNRRRDCLQPLHISMRWLVLVCPGLAVIVRVD